MTQKLIGLRVDVDFEIGLVKGVPFLLDFFDRAGIKSTFYVTMGPDSFSKNRNRIKTPGYLRRLANFNPWKMLTLFGPKYLLRQFSGNYGNVGSDHPHILKNIIARGHELGVHGYDHYWWAENIWNASALYADEQIRKSIEAFQSSTGAPPVVWASPNWRCSEDSLQLIEKYKFEYGADCRGVSPFFPVVNGREGTLPQFPISLPCLHEIKGYLGTNSADLIIAEFMRNLSETYNVWCIHCYYEGILERDLFTRLVDKIKEQGYSLVPIVTLRSVWDLSAIPSCKVIRKALPGGRGQISFQG